MALSLKESRTVAEMAELLYEFLPGSGNPQWKGHVSFKTVAEKIGVGDFWQPGSKIPMITALLARTLEFRRGRFEPLLLEVVRAGLTYRQKQGSPVKPAVAAVHLGPEVSRPACRGLRRCHRLDGTREAALCRRRCRRCRRVPRVTAVLAQPGGYWPHERRMARAGNALLASCLRCSRAGRGFLINWWIVPD